MQTGILLLIILWAPQKNYLDPLLIVSKTDLYWLLQAYYFTWCIHNMMLHLQTHSEYFLHNLRNNQENHHRYWQVLDRFQNNCRFAGQEQTWNSVLLEFSSNWIEEQTVSNIENIFGWIPMFIMLKSFWEAMQCRKNNIDFL